MEIKNLFKMQLNERTVAVNEYGTNLIKNKYDPLAVIEAKVAMSQGKTKRDACHTMKEVEKEATDITEQSTAT
jgi:hypothetical protein